MDNSEISRTYNPCKFVVSTYPGSLHFMRYDVRLSCADQSRIPVNTVSKGMNYNINYDLEAISHDLSECSITVIADQVAAYPNFPNRLFLSYYIWLPIKYRAPQQDKTNLSHDGLNPAHVTYKRMNNPTRWGDCNSMIERACLTTV